MSEEPVIGGESAPEESADGEAEAMTPETDASEAELAALLRETLLAAHDDLAAEDLAGETPAEVRERYVAARARLEQEAGEAPEAPVPAGAPGRFAPAPGTPSRRSAKGSPG